MGCHFLDCVHARLLQSCPTFRDPMDRSPPSSSVHGILLAGILEWVVILSSRGSSWPRDQTFAFCISCIAGGFFATDWPLEMTCHFLDEVIERLSLTLLSLLCFLACFFWRTQVAMPGADLWEATKQGLEDSNEPSVQQSMRHWYWHNHVSEPEWKSSLSQAFRWLQPHPAPDCILNRDLEAENPAELYQIPEHRNLEIVFVILNLYFFMLIFLWIVSSYLWNVSFSIAWFVFIFNWSISALQCCVSLCCIAAWISSTCTYIPSLWDLLPIPPLSHPSRLLLSTEVSSLCYMA